MKKRTKEEMTKYRRDLRARKKAQCHTRSCHTRAGFCHTRRPPDVNPDFMKNSRTGKIHNAAPFPCPNCERLRADLLRERAEVSRLKDELMQQAQRPKAGRHAEKISKDDAEALRQRVIADKVGRINSYSRGHVIGTART